MTGPPAVDDGGYGAARAGAVWHVRDPRPVLRVEGADAETFLHSMLTQDVKGLARGRASVAYTDRMGKMLAAGRLLRNAGGFWLESDPASAEALASKLKMYVLSSKVTFEPAPAWFVVGVHGPKAAEVVAAAGLPGPGDDQDHREAEYQGAPAQVVRVENLGRPGVELRVEPAAQESLLAALEDAGAARLSPDAALALRVEAGIAEFGEDYAGEAMPTEVGLDGAVSYHKGCYMGQEILERMRSRGVRTRELLVVVLEDDDPPPAAGAALVRGGAEVGILTSPVRSPGRQRAVGLAVVPVKKAGHGDRVEVEGRSATLLAPPLKEESS